MKKIIYIGSVVLMANIVIANGSNNYKGWDFVSTKVGAQYDYKLTIKSPDNKTMSESHLWKNIVSCRDEGSDKCVHLLNFVKPTDEKIYYIDNIYRNMQNGVFSTLITKKPKDVRNIDLTEVFKHEIEIGKDYSTSTKIQYGVESQTDYKYIALPEITVNTNKYSNCIKAVSVQTWVEIDSGNQDKHRANEEIVYCVGFGEVRSIAKYFVNDKHMMSSISELLSIKYPFD